MQVPILLWEHVVHTSGERNKTGTLSGVVHDTLDGIGIEVPGDPSSQ